MIVKEKKIIKCLRLTHLAPPRSIRRCISSREHSAASPDDADGGGVGVIPKPKAYLFDFIFCLLDK